MKFVQNLFYSMLLIGITYGYPKSDIKAPVQLNLANDCLHVLRGKQNDKPPVLLLHDLLAYKGVWLSLMPLISMKTGRKVCAADLRNHGDSFWSNETDTATMASDLNRLLKSFKTKNIALLGHGLGGKVAVDFALKNPEKVEKLIVEDMRPNGLSKEAREHITGSKKPVTLKFSSNGSTEAEANHSLLNFLDHIFYSCGLGMKLDEEFPDINSKCGQKTNVARLEKVRQDIDQYIPESKGLFEKPTLFIYGGKSPYKVGHAREEILKLFPKAKLAEIERAPHVVYTFPKYLTSVVSFLNNEHENQ